LKNGKADVYLQWSRKNYFFLTVNFFLYMLHNCFFAQTFGVNLCQWSQTRGLWATCMWPTRAFCAGHDAYWEFSNN